MIFAFTNIRVTDSLHSPLDFAVVALVDTFADPFVDFVDIPFAVFVADISFAVAEPPRFVPPSFGTRSATDLAASSVVAAGIAVVVGILQSVENKIINSTKTKISFKNFNYYKSVTVSQQPFLFPDQFLRYSILVASSHLVSPTPVATLLVLALLVELVVLEFEPDSPAGLAEALVVAGVFVLLAAVTGLVEVLDCVTFLGFVRFPRQNPEE